MSLSAIAPKTRSAREPGLRRRKRASGRGASGVVAAVERGPSGRRTRNARAGPGQRTARDAPRRWRSWSTRELRRPAAPPRARPWPRSPPGARRPAASRGRSCRARRRQAEARSRRRRLVHLDARLVDHPVQRRPDRRAAASRTTAQRLRQRRLADERGPARRGRRPPSRARSGDRRPELLDVVERRSTSPPRASPAPRWSRRGGRRGRPRGSPSSSPRRAKATNAAAVIASKYVSGTAGAASAAAKTSASARVELLRRRRPSAPSRIRSVTSIRCGDV